MKTNSTFIKTDNELLMTAKYLQKKKERLTNGK